MKAKEFVKKLSELKPKREDIDKGGVSEKYVLRVLESYDSSPKNEEYKPNVDEIVNLINCYDVSKVEIGSIDFLDEPVIDEKFIYFGSSAGDNLAIEIDSGMIVMVEYGLHHIISECAENGNKFLDAFILAAKIITEYRINSSLSDDQGIACGVALKCAKLAGGDLYLPFYKTLLGCFE
jgi:hypothetical protein